jgi:hypothetical protein
VTTTSTLSESHLDYSRQLLRLHALIRAGEGDSEAAEAIRDEMDESYRKLSPEEIDRFNLLAADLNSIAENGGSGADALTVEEIGRRIALGFALPAQPEELRLWVDPDAVNAASNAFVRFLYWARLGDRQAARPFAEFVIIGLERDVREMGILCESEALALNVALARSSGVDFFELERRIKSIHESKEKLNVIESSIMILKNHIGLLADTDPIGQANPEGLAAQAGISDNDVDLLVSLISSASALRSMVQAA